MKSSNANLPIYYVYALLDTRCSGPFRYGRYAFRFKPFYVGKGKGNRPNSHLTMARGNGTRSKSQKSIKIRNIVKATGEIPEIRIVKRDMLEQDAFEFERKLIQSIGRIQLKTGPLVNRSDGGEGQKNIVYTEEYRKMFSDRLKNIWSVRSSEYIASIFDKVKKTKANRTAEQISAEAVKRPASMTRMMAALTEEQKLSRIQKGLDTCAKRSDDERLALCKKIAIARQKFFDNLSDEEYTAFHKSVARKNRKQWLSLTDEERADIIDNRARGLQKYWNGATDEQRKRHSASIKTALRSRSVGEETLRGKRISRSLKKVYADDPSICQRAGAAAARTKAGWTEEQRSAFVDRCVAGNRSSDPTVRKKMSVAGRRRVNNMTDAEKRIRATKLSTSIKRAWDLVPEADRAARINKAQAKRDTPAIAKKISKSVAKVHASRSPEERQRVVNKIAATLRNKSPADRQRTACGNAMRGLLKRNGLIQHPVIRPKLDAMINRTVFTGEEQVRTMFLKNCQRVISAWKPVK